MLGSFPLEPPPGRRLRVPDWSPSSYVCCWVAESRIGLGTSRSRLSSDARLGFAAPSVGSLHSFLRRAYLIFYCGTTLLSRGETTDCRHGDERQRDSRYGPRATHQPHHGHQRTEKKESELQPVHHNVLAVLHPEQVEVEVWRADELEVRRGLSSELDEMWS